MHSSGESSSSANGTFVHVESNGTSRDCDTTPALPKDREELPVNSNFCMHTLLLTTASVMMPIGLAVGALNPTLVILSTFYNETYQMRHDQFIPDNTLDALIALTVSMLLAGGFLGALSLGIFVKLFTRKKAMVVINSLNIVAVVFVSIAGYLIPSYEAVIIGRFTMGFVSGIAMNLIPMITSETSTKAKAAFYLSLIGVYLSFGGLVGLMLGHKKVMGNDQLWPFLLAVPGLPSLVYVIFSPMLPETPSYFLLVGDKKQAFRTLKKLRKVNNEVLLHKELEAIQREQEAQGSRSQSVTLIEMFKKAGYRRQLFVVVMVFLESQFCGINGIGMYTDIIFKEAGIDPDYVTYASMVVYTVQFLVALIGSKAVDKWGPRRLSIFWSMVMFLSLTLLTISMATYHQAPPMAYISVFAVTLYVLAWACGPNITLFPLVAALTTEPTREATFKFGGGLFWIASWFVGFVPTYFMKYMGPYAFVPWALCNLLFTIFFFIKIPETRGKTTEEIQCDIQGKSFSNTAEIMLKPMHLDNCTES